jgi:hypothetical protein
MQKEPKRSKKHKRHLKNTIQYSKSLGMLSSIEKMLGLDTLFDGKMTHTSFDCPRNLRQAFNEECRGNGTSCCQELRRFQVLYVITSRLKKHAYGNTISQAIDANVSIGNLSFTQNVQSRPRRLLREPAKGNEVSEEPKCRVRNCGRVAVTIALYVKTGKVYSLCRIHEFQYKKTPSAWSFRTSDIESAQRSNSQESSEGESND